VPEHDRSHTALARRLPARPVVLGNSDARSPGAASWPPPCSPWPPGRWRFAAGPPDPGPSGPRRRRRPGGRGS